MEKIIALKENESLIGSQAFSDHCIKESTKLKKMLAEHDNISSRHKEKIQRWIEALGVMGDERSVLFSNNPENFRKEASYRLPSGTIDKIDIKEHNYKEKNRIIDFYKKKERDGSLTILEERIVRKSLIIMGIAEVILKQAD